MNKDEALDIMENKAELVSFRKDKYNEQHLSFQPGGTFSSGFFSNGMPPIHEIYDEVPDFREELSDRMAAAFNACRGVPTVDLEKDMLARLREVLVEAERGLKAASRGSRADGWYESILRKVQDGLSGTGHDTAPVEAEALRGEVETPNIIKAMQRAAAKIINDSNDGHGRCKYCGGAGGPHGPDCPAAVATDIMLIPIDPNTHLPRYAPTAPGGESFMSEEFMREQEKRAWEKWDRGDMG